MTINVTWPSNTHQAYEIEVQSESSDAGQVRKLTSGNEEFDRFKDLTRKLVNTPKHNTA